MYYDEDDDEDMDDFQPKKFVKKMEGTKVGFIIYYGLCMPYLEVSSHGRKLQVLQSVSSHCD